MRHKILIDLQDLLEYNPVLLSDIAELDEIFRGHIAKDTLFPFITHHTFKDFLNVTRLLCKLVLSI